MQEFNLPEIGEGVVEGEIVEWHVNVGDAVSPDQPLVSVLTDKATVEIASDFTGVIAAVHGDAGDIVEVGAKLVGYTAEGQAAEVPAPQEEPPAPKNNGQAAAQSGEAGDVLNFPLPEIGEGVMEGELVEWLVQAGDSVKGDQPVVSVLTDKATVEITAPTDGVVQSVKGEPGDILEVGDTIMVLQVAAGEGDAPAASSSSAPAASQPVAEAASAPAAPTAAADTSGGEVDPADNPSISAFGTPLATPAVRRLASQKGVDLRSVRGSGPNNRITRQDVERVASGAVKPAAAKPSTPAAPVAAAPQEEETRERLRGLRKAIHKSMTISKSTVPHFTYVDEVEMDQLVALRAGLKAEAAEQGAKLTYLPFIAKACVLALRKYPILNASVDDEAEEIVYKKYYNIGIATATESGLTVPVVKAVDKKSVLELSKEIADITGRARNKRSTMDDITGGTFTITSLGRLGGILATPIINYPEVAIMGIHNLQERAVVRNGEIVVRQMMNISLSFDHRVVDGDVGATFAQEVKSYLENPGKLMLHMA